MASSLYSFPSVRQVQCAYNLNHLEVFASLMFIRRGRSYAFVVRVLRVKAKGQYVGGRILIPLWLDSSPFSYNFPVGKS